MIVDGSAATFIIAHARFGATGCSCYYFYKFVLKWVERLS
jgi:hypothetical protein